MVIDDLRQQIRNLNQEKWIGINKEHPKLIYIQKLPDRYYGLVDEVNIEGDTISFHFRFAVYNYPDFENAISPYDWEDSYCGIKDRWISSSLLNVDEEVYEMNASTYTNSILKLCEHRSLMWSD